MSLRRMLPFLFLNIVVSATVVLVILYIWDDRNPAPVAVEENLQQFESLPEVIAEAEPTRSLFEPAEDVSQEEEVPSGVRVHVVGAGETLGIISFEYEVPIAEILEANGMDNPNFISVGQELIIPEAGEPLPTAEPSEEESGIVELPTPIPTEPAASGESSIEIDTVIGRGDLPLEAIQIVNNGSSAASLAGWYITDQGANSYEFGTVTIFGDGAGILLHTMAGPDSATDYFWGLEDPLWQSGDLVVLYDSSGEIQTQFQVP